LNKRLLLRHQKGGNEQNETGKPAFHNLLILSRTGE
jgi:hypothetical protein